MTDTATARRVDHRRRQRRPQRRGFAGFVREVLVVVVGALVVSSLLRFFVGQMFIIPSPSMEHTLDVGDRVAVSKITAYHRGDVVVFADPGDWLSDGTRSTPPTVLDKVLEFIGVPVDAGTEYLIKRVIGLPGDHVVCCDAKGRVTVNGQALDEKSYLYRDEDGRLVKPSDVSFDVTVPAGHLWVMGDHRNDSADSRCHLQDIGLDGVTGGNAFVPESDVVGPAIAVVLPFDRFTRLKPPATFAAVPDPARAPPDQPVIKDKDVIC